MTPTTRRLIEQRRDTLAIDIQAADNQIKDAQTLLTGWQEKRDLLSVQLAEIKADLAQREG
jgi:hypothetical protein